MVGLGLDRVLWSYWRAKPPGTAPFDPKHLDLVAGDVVALAHVALRHGIDLTEDRVDRVFLNRAVEHVLSARILCELRPKGYWAELLSQLADPAWVANAYGLRTDAETDEGDEEPPDFDERGANSACPPRREERSERNVDALASRLIERWQRGRFIGGAGVLDSYARGASVWLGSNPFALTPEVSATARTLHGHLAELCQLSDGVDWNARRSTLSCSTLRSLDYEHIVRRPQLPTAPHGCVGRGQQPHAGLVRCLCACGAQSHARHMGPEGRCAGGTTLSCCAEGAGPRP